MPRVLRSGTLWQLEFVAAGAGGSWSWWQLEFVAAGAHGSWSSWQLELVVAGACGSWPHCTCLQEIEMVVGIQLHSPPHSSQDASPLDRATHI